MSLRPHHARSFGLASIVAASLGGAALADETMRFMKLNDATVGGRRVTFSSGTIVTFHKDHAYTATGTVELQLFGVGREAAPAVARGRWDVRFGNTIYVTFESGRSRSFHFWKDGNVLHFRSSGGSSLRVARIEAAD